MENKIHGIGSMAQVKCLNREKSNSDIKVGKISFFKEDSLRTLKENSLSWVIYHQNFDTHNKDEQPNPYSSEINLILVRISKIEPKSALFYSFEDFETDNATILNIVPFKPTFHNENCFKNRAVQIIAAPAIPIKIELMGLDNSKNITKCKDTNKIVECIQNKAPANSSSICSEIKSLKKNDLPAFPVAKLVKKTAVQNKLNNLIKKPERRSNHLVETGKIILSNRESEKNRKLLNLENNHECVVCHAKFFSNTQLYIHIKCHRQQTFVQCSLCNLVFLREASLKIHQDSHKEEASNNAKVDKPKHYHCSVCNESFHKVEDLNFHMLLHARDRIYKCDECDRIFYIKRLLISHIKELHNQKPPKQPNSYQCSYCGKLFNVKNSFNSHVKIHQNIEPMKCSYCDYATIRAPELKIHLRSHTGEKPYCCDICGNRYRTASIFAIHKRNHTGEKPYQCNVCQLSFVTKQLLTRHSFIHTTVRPFPCSFCNKGFIRKYKLKEHLRKEHPGCEDLICARNS